MCIELGSRRGEKGDVEVPTYTETETFNHGLQVDESPASVRYTTGPSNIITRVNLFKKYDFGDEMTAQDFHAKYKAFQDRLRDVIRIYQQLAIRPKKYSQEICKI